MQFEVGQAVAQEDHALLRVAAVLAVRVFLDQLLEGFEGLARMTGGRCDRSTLNLRSSQLDWRSKYTRPSCSRRSRPGIGSDSRV